MTPQETRAPALPVVLLRSTPPRPKSSESACTTKVRPIIECGPLNNNRFIFDRLIELYADFEKSLLTPKKLGYL